MINTPHFQLLGQSLTSQRIADLFDALLQQASMLDSAVNLSVGRQLQNAKGDLVQQLTKAAKHEAQLGSIVQHSASSINGALSSAVKSNSQLELAQAAAFDAADTARMEQISDALLDAEWRQQSDATERERERLRLEERELEVSND